MRRIPYTVLTCWSVRQEVPSEAVAPPTKFGLIINMKTAKAPGFAIPQSCRLRADEVIGWAA